MCIVKFNMSKIFRKLLKRHGRKKQFLPLNDVLKHKHTRLPCVVQMEISGNTDFGQGNEDSDGTSRNSVLEMFVEKKAKLQFVRIEIMEFPLDVDAGTLSPT